MAGFDTTNATNSVNSAANAGAGAISSFDPTATGQSNLGSLNTMLNNQGNQAGDFQKAYSAAVGANPSVTSLYNTGNAMFNVPALQTTATQLQNAVSQATPQAYDTAKGFDYSNSQVQNEINKNLQFLEPEAAAASNAANTASGLAQGYVQSGVTQNQMNLLPIQNTAQLLSQQQAAQQTGWNQNAANTLQALTAKMNAGVSLSQTEMQSFVSLSQQQEQYQAAVVGAQAQIQAANIGQQYKILSPTQSLVNTFNGQVTPYSGGSSTPNNSVNQVVAQILQNSQNGGNNGSLGGTPNYYGNTG